MGVNEIYNAFLNCGNNINEFLRLISADKASDTIKRSMFNTLMRAQDQSSGGWSTTVGKGVKGIFNLIKTQEESAIPTITEQILKLSDAEKLLINNNGDLKNVSDIFSGLLKGSADLIGNQILLYLNEQNGLLEEINTKTSLTGKLSRDYRDEITNTIPDLVKIGVGLNDISSATVSLINQTGRFNLLSSSTWIESAKVAKAYVGTLDNMVNSFVSFEKVGIGAKDTTKYLEDAGRNSLNVGIESRKVTKEIQTNIGKLNEYGFKTGVQGLSEMVKKAIEFRTNIQTTFDVAEKLFDLDSVLEMSSNLQVLGGAIGDFADPLKLMYMATNDVNGLQDAIIGATKGLATYNSEQKRFEITGANLRIAKDRAKALGIEYQEFASMAIASNERVQASMDLLGATGIDDKLKEFLTNMARMDGGEMKITIPGDLKKQFNELTEVSLKDVGRDPELIKAFKTYQDEFKKMSKEDIIENQASNIKNIERYVSFMAASIRVQGGKTIGNLADTYGINFLEEAKKYTKDYVTTEKGKMLGEEFYKNISNTLGIKNIPKNVDVNNLNLPNVQTKNEEKIINNQTSISKSELTIFIKNDGAVLDAITREIVKDPKFAKTIRELIDKEQSNKN